jgi:uncharacterized SAM-binding protein YcdF (DUF218 family)
MKKTKKRIVTRSLLYVLGTFLFVNSSVLLFASNVHTGIFAEFIFGVAFLLCAVFFDQFLDKTPMWLKYLCVAVCTIICAATLFLLSHGVADTANYDEDVLIVLGAGVNGTQVGENLKRRLDSALDYLEKNPDAYIAVSGGQGYQEEISEALAMEEYLLSKGVLKDKIIKEDKASSTYENFVFTKKILDEKIGEDYTLCFTTNEFHIYRAQKIARKAGFDKITHIHAPTKATTIVSNGIRECLAVIKYALIKK